MLCQRGDTEILEDPGYLFQPKLDGTRALWVAGRLINRRGRDITHRYPELADLPVDPDAVVDGEVIVYDTNGLPDFSMLQSREQTSKALKIEILSARHPATYVVFDCVGYHGDDITGEPLETRLDCLRDVVKEEASPRVQVIFTTADGRSLWAKVREWDLEGIVAKKRGSSYMPGARRQEWLKVKNLLTIDCVITGYTKGEGRRAGTLGALTLGLYHDGELVPVGRVGTGWTDRELEHLKGQLDPLVTDEVEWDGKADDAVPVKPELVCEVEYLALTGDGHLRGPSFQRLRYDKPPEACLLPSRD